MALFWTLLRYLPSTCSHTHAYRERRRLHGVQVMHFVCERCGHAAPAVERTAREHRRAVKVGGRPNTRVVRQPARVVLVADRQTRRPA